MLLKSEKSSDGVTTELAFPPPVVMMPAKNVRSYRSDFLEIRNDRNTKGLEKIFILPQLSTASIT